MCVVERTSHSSFSRTQYPVVFRAGLNSKPDVMSFAENPEQPSDFSICARLLSRNCFTAIPLPNAELQSQFGASSNVQPSFSSSQNQSEGSEMTFPLRSFSSELSTRYRMLRLDIFAREATA